MVSEKFIIKCIKCNSDDIRIIKCYDFGYCDSYEFDGRFGIKCLRCNSIEIIDPRYETHIDTMIAQRRENE